MSDNHKNLNPPFGKLRQNGKARGQWVEQQLGPLDKEHAYAMLVMSMHYSITDGPGIVIGLCSVPAKLDFKDGTTFQTIAQLERDKVFPQGLIDSAKRKLQDMDTTSAFVLLIFFQEPDGLFALLTCTPGGPDEQLTLTA